MHMRLRVSSDSLDGQSSWVGKMHFNDDPFHAPLLYLIMSSQLNLYIMLIFTYYLPIIYLNLSFILLMLKNISRLWSTRIQHCSPTVKVLKCFSPTVTLQQSSLWKRVNFYFSAKMYDLNSKQQKAITSYYVLQYLKEFDPKTYLQSTKSLRQTLFDQQTLKAFILESINRERVTKIESFSLIGIDDSTIKEAVEGFGFEKGALVDTDIWSQFRYKQAITSSLPSSLKEEKKQVYITLNPQHHSSIIINQLIIKQTPFIVYGEKGTGKSFSYLIYDHISKNMINYKIQQANNELFYELVPKIQFGKIRKLIYFPLKEMESFQDTAQTLLKQISEIEISSLNANSITDSLSFLKFFKKYLKLLKKFYFQQNNIEIILIIDEANYYYSLFREYQKSLHLKGANPISQDGKMFQFQYTPESHPIRYKQLRNIELGRTKGKEYDDLRQQQKLLFFSKMLSNFKILNHHVNLVLNSSQQVEAKAINQWNSSCSPKFYDITAHGRNGSLNLNIKYTENLLSSQFQLQLYHIFLFEIQRQLHIQSSNKTKQQKKKVSEAMRELKKIFLRTFKIVERNEQKPNQSFKRWLIDVRHFNIRQQLQKQDFTNLLLLIKNMNEKQAQISDIFIKMKVNIQNLRQQQIGIKGFQNYLLKSTNKFQFSIRFFVLLLIRRKAIQQQKDSAQDLEFSFNYLDQLGSSTGQYYIRAFEQITFQLNLGFLDKSKKKIIFYMSPVFLEKLTNFLKKEYTFLQCVGFLKVLKTQGFAPGLAGNIIDIGFHQVLKSSNFDLKLNIYGTQFLIKEGDKLFKIKQSISHLVSPNKNAEEIYQSLKELFILSQNHPNQYFAAYPLHLTKDGYLQYRTNNGVYDLAINQLDSRKGTHQLILIDITMGEINNKLKMQKYQLLKEKLDELTTKTHDNKKITLTYIIMAPQSRVVDYMVGARSTKNHFAVGKYCLKLGSFSQNLNNNLILHNVKRQQKTDFNDFFTITIKESINHFDKTY